MFSEKIDEIVGQLEKNELEASEGLPSEFYLKLFAAYLLKNDLCNARYLWKRLPEKVKSTDEFGKIYKVYLSLWNNHLSDFFLEVSSEWPRDITEMMFELKEKVQQETIHLIGLAYSSILIDNFSQLLHQSASDVTKLCNTIDWSIEDGLIIPKRPIVSKMKSVSCEEQLAKLTDFVSFLEN